MSLRKTVLLLAAAIIAIAALPAQAQFAAYGTFTVNQLSGIKGSPATAPCTSPTNTIIVNGIVTSCPPYNDSVNPLGGTFGAYYDFLKLGPVKLGADLRGTLTTTKRGAEAYSNGSGARVYSGLGGIRAVFHTHFVPVRPYIQASAGLGRTDYGVSPLTQVSTTGKVNLVNNFEYEGFAGVDITLLPYMDFRMVEFGYGGLNPFGTNSHNYPIKSVSSGIVIHLPF
jgi:hypothetical protein